MPHKKGKRRSTTKARGIHLSNAAVRRNYRRKRYSKKLTKYVANVFEGLPANFAPVKRSISGCHSEKGTYIIRTGCVPLGTAMKNGLHGIPYAGASTKYLHRKKKSRKGNYAQFLEKVKKAYARNH